MPFSIWRLTVSLPYPPSLASRSNTRVPPDSLSHLRAKLTISPPLATRLCLFLPLFLWYLSLLPSLIFHLAAWDFSFPLCASLSGIFSLHTSPQLPPLTHPLSSRFLSLRFRSSIFLSKISLAFFIPPPVHPSLRRSL